ncbi:hypothetical protein [Synechococcus sp. CBW1107]|uniref:hypothetical protein n=1 Tax=Synechococcus sp. CBW1107 TaxID=2789857 RepID=UPI002AD27B9F|nr:hypothetical protein [Synechococcus sp. CBW1107]CAK6696087.1 hypothetical protein MNNICLKF_01972 [Synechococcus sp. CBW1107]
MPLPVQPCLDLSNENLACVQNGVGAQVSYVQAVPDQVSVTPAPSAGDSFFGSVLSGAIGGVIGNAINGDNRTEVHHYHDQRRGNNADKTTAETKPSRKVTLPGGATLILMHPALRKPIQLVQNTTSSGGNLGNIPILGAEKLSGFKPPIPGNLGGRLPF